MTEKVQQSQEDCLSVALEQAQMLEEIIPYFVIRSREVADATFTIIDYVDYYFLWCAGILLRQYDPVS